MEYEKWFSKSWTGARGVIINNEFHVIGGQSKHLRYNQQTIKFDVVHDFNPRIICPVHRLINIKN